MKTLQKFCCCLSLTKGAILIGCFKIIATVVLSIQIILNILKENAQKEEPDRGWVFYLFIVKQVIVNIIVILLAIFLILGAKRRNPNFVLPWLMWTIVIFFLNAFSLLRFLKTMETPLLIQEVTLLCLTVYFWLVVFSLYRVLKSEQMSTKNNWRMHSSA